MGGSAYVNIMYGGLCSSTTLRAAVSASSMCLTPVCDLTLPICVLYRMLSIVRMMPFASCRSSLCGGGGEAERANGVFAYGVDAEGAIC